MLLHEGKMDKRLFFIRLIAVAGMCLTAVSARADRISELEDQVKMLRDSLARIQDELQLERKNRVPTDSSSNMPKLVNQAASTPPTEISGGQKSSSAAPTSAKPLPTGYIQVPGTSSAVKFGGTIRVEVADDIISNQGGRTDDATAIPASGTAKANRDGALNGSISGSRFNFATLSNSDIGDISSLFEFDLGTEFSSSFRLRHAYFSTGNWLAGQTWSTFMDMDTLPDLLAAGGSAGHSWLRRPQLRYGFKIGQEGRIDLATEMPSSDYTAVNAINTAPDLVARYTADPSWGHYSLGGMLRYFRSDNGLGANTDEVVWGLIGGIGIKLFGDDLLTFQTVNGTGVGNVLNQGTGKSAILVGNSFQTFDTYGGTVAYKHVWMPNLRSTVAVGYSHFANAARNTGSNGLGISSLSSAHANIIYSPIQRMDVGLEYGYEAFTAKPRGSGDASRILGVVKYGY
jgi:hypothetical protein